MWNCLALIYALFITNQCIHYYLCSPLPSPPLFRCLSLYFFVCVCVEDSKAHVLTTATININHTPILTIHGSVIRSLWLTSLVCGSSWQWSNLPTPFPVLDNHQPTPLYCSEGGMIRLPRRVTSHSIRLPASGFFHSVFLLMPPSARTLLCFLSYSLHCSVLSDSKARRGNDSREVRTPFQESALRNMSISGLHTLPTFCVSGASLSSHLQSTGLQRGGYILYFKDEMGLYFAWGHHI